MNSLTASQQQLFVNGHVVSISKKDNGIALTKHWRIEHKAQVAEANGVQLGATLMHSAPIDRLQVRVPKIAGWVRVTHELDAPAHNAVLAVRLLVRLYSERGASHEQIRPILAEEVNGQLLAIAGCSEDMTLKSGEWVQVRALFACDAKGGKLALMVNLPKDATIEIASFDYDWFEIVSASDETAAAQVSPIVTFQAMSLSDEAVASLCAATPIYAAELERVDSELRGWALMRDQNASLVVVSGQGMQSVTPDSLVEIYPNVAVMAGFSVGAVAEFEGSETIKLLAAGTSNVPLATLQVSEKSSADTRLSYPPPKTLFFFPDYTATNPYQSLMYKGMPELDARPGSVDEAIEYTQAQGPAVLHLHWLTPIFSTAQTSREAQQQCARFVEKLDYFKNIGGQIMWTVHNLISHGSNFEEAEVWLSQRIVELANTVHVHSRTLLPLIAEFYDIPDDKLIIAAHPSYVGHYPDYVTREQARVRLALPENAKVFIFIGQLRPYKGIDTLVEAMNTLQAYDPDCHLLIIGKPIFPYAPGLLQRKYQGQSNVHVIEGHVPDNSMQWYYRAADWVVLPYNNILTSGSLLCALSFSCPVIAPDLGMISDVLKTGSNGILYDLEDPDGLDKALLEAAQTPAETLERYRADALASVKPLTWEKMGATLQDAVSAAHQMRAMSAVTQTLEFEDGAHDAILLGKAFPPKKPARVSIIILNYENLDDVQRLIATLKKSSFQDFDIYVVDNASPNLSLSDLDLELTDVYVLRLTENLGYAAGNNAALRLTEALSYEFTWILNPDMVVSPKALEQHIAAAHSHKDHSIFGATILQGGNSSVIASAGGYVSFEDGLSTNHMYGGEPISVLPLDPFEADFITGASIFFRTAVLKDIGFIPEDYFLYFEETHWLLEASRRGFKCLVLPNIMLAHHKRSEEGGLPAKYYYYYFVRNALLFTRRMTGAAPNATLRRLRAGFLSAWEAKIAKRAPAEAAVYSLIAERAIKDGLAGLSGKIDLISLELGSAHGDTHSNTYVDNFKSSMKPDGTVTGSFSLNTRAIKSPAITLICDGKILETVPCIVKGSQQSFSIKVSRAKLGGQLRHFQFYINGCIVPGAVLTRMLEREAPVYKGRIDGIAQFNCLGWIWNESDPDEAVPFEILYNGEVVADGAADVYRADLERSGIADGVAGFSVRMPRRFSDDSNYLLQLRVAGTDKIIFERLVRDHEIQGGAQPQPVAQALDDLFYRRHLWLAKYDLSDLPLGRHIAKTQKTLIARHAGQNQSVKVSVVMPAFDRADTIEQAIESVRAQSHENWELLIADDGSSDSTVAVVRALIARTGDERIKLFELGENRGVSAARNVSLKAASGSVIAYLDSDNNWRPEYLNVMVSELVAQPDTVLAAYCGQEIRQVRRLGNETIQETVAIRMGDFSLALMENRNFIDLNCFVHRQKAFVQIGGFNEEMRRLVDWELILRYSRVCAPHYVPVLLSNYYFDMAGNQITKLVSYEASLDILRKSLKVPPKGARTDTAQKTDVVLLTDGTAYPAAKRARELLSRLPKDARLLVGVSAAAQGSDDAFAKIGDPRLVVCEIDINADVVGQNISFEALMLADALVRRREGADLAVLTANAFPNVGWLDAFGRAAEAVPDSGILVSRKIVAGNRPEVEIAAPFAARNLDACITLSHTRRNVVVPVLDRSEHLTEISGFDAFCFVIRANVAATLAGNDAQGGIFDDAVQEITDFVRICLKKRVVYCAKAMVHSIPVV